MKKYILLFIVLAALICCATACKKTPETTATGGIPTPFIPNTDKEIAYMSNGLQYVIDSDVTCHIISVGNFKGDTLDIPAADSEGRVVTSVSDYAFKDCTTLKKVTFPKSVNEIGGGAFQGCTGLNEVAFSEGLTKIGVWAFYGCTSLTKISFPASVEIIGQGSFSLCSGITSYSVASGNKKFVAKDDVLYNSDMTTLLIYPIGKTSTSFTVPQGVKTINNASFSDCQNIVTVKMASTVENIADHAFRRCSKLTTVTLSESLTRIGVGSFYECTALKTVNYPGTKEKWEDEEQMELGNTWDRGAGDYDINYDYKG